MSEMAAVLVAVMAFAVAAAARLGEGTETDTPEAQPRQSMVLRDRHPAGRSVVTQGDEP